MDTLDNLRAFLVTVKLGNFSEAARELNVVPSVIAKRINQLEWTLGATLFQRSTRKVALTASGQAFHPKAGALVEQFDGIVRDFEREDEAVEGHVRLKAPTSLTVLYLADILARFKRVYPAITLDVMLVDRSVNPIEEGYDIAIGGRAAAYEGVIDEPLCPLRQLLCASPAYLAQAGKLVHPRDLLDHPCLVFNPIGNTWMFDSVRGPVTVDVPITLSSNDNHMLYTSACAGIGVAILPSYVAQQAVDSGTLKEVLTDFPLQATWLKAQVPQRKAGLRRVQVLLDWLRENLGATPPWERGVPAGAASSPPPLV